MARRNQRTNVACRGTREVYSLYEDSAFREVDSGWREMSPVS